MASFTSLDDDTIYGTGVSDTLYGFDGNDTLFGGGGDDVFIQGIAIWENTSLGLPPYLETGSLYNFGRGDDTIYGGSGEDTLSYAGLTSDVSVNFGTQNAVTEYGTDFFDSIELIITGSGNDTVYGAVYGNAILGAGNDTIVNISNGSTYDGGSGSDTLSLINEFNAVYVDLTQDLVMVGGAETASVYNFENVVGALSVGNTIITNGGANKLTGGDKADNLRSGKGGDTIIGGAGSDVIKGQKGNDVLYAENENGDVSDGFYSSNYFPRKDEKSFVYGGEGNDEIYSGNTSSDMYGGNGHDTFNVGHHSVWTDTDGLSPTYAVYGGNGDDQINVGSDTGTGRIRQGIFKGGNGKDTFDIANTEGGIKFYGEEDNDTFILRDSSRGDLNYYTYHIGSKVYGQAGDDTFIVSEFNSKIYGGGGDDTVIAKNTAKYFLGDGNDTITMTSGGHAYGGAGSDTFTTIGHIGNGKDVLFADGGNLIDGGEGYDILYTEARSVYIDNGNNLKVKNFQSTDLVVKNVEEIHLVGQDMIVTVYGDGFVLDSRGSGANVRALTLWGDNNTVWFDDTDNTLHLRDSNGSLIYGGEGINTYNIDGSFNTIHGGSDVDRFDISLRHVNSNNIMYGREGNDSLTASGNNNTFYGAQGIDTFVFNSGSQNAFYGGSGEDRAFQRNGTDAIFNMGKNNDTVTLWGGDSTVDLGNGSDFLFIEASNHSISSTVTSGSGYDVISIDADAHDDVSLTVTDFDIAKDSFDILNVNSLDDFTDITQVGDNVVLTITSGSPTENGIEIILLNIQVSDLTDGLF